MGFNQRTPTVIPSLHEWSEGEGRFSLTPQTRLLVHERDAPRLHESARFLQQEILQRTGLSLPSDLGTESAPGNTHYLTPNLGLAPDENFLFNNWELSAHPNSLGYKICVWADEAEDEPDEYFESPLRIPRAILAERTWNPDKPAKELSAFRRSLEELLSDG